jgi:hypothetical protein
VHRCEERAKLLRSGDNKNIYGKRTEAGRTRNELKKFISITNGGSAGMKILQCRKWQEMAIITKSP